MFALLLTWWLLPKSRSPMAHEAVRKEWIGTWGHATHQPPGAEDTLAKVAGRHAVLGEQMPKHAELTDELVAALTHTDVEEAQLREAIRTYARLRAEQLIRSATRGQD